MVSQWYEDFFRGLAVELWTAVGTEEITHAESDFLEEELQLRDSAQVDPARVLDVPCGSGRHAVALARRGHQVTGVDLSDAFLEIARRNAGVEWIQADMRNPPRRTFDAAYCWGNSFGYLEHAGTIAFLRNLAAVLRNDARFVLDTGTVAESLLAAFQTSSEYQFGGIHLHIERDYDCRRSRYLGKYTFERDGVVEVRHMEQSIYTCAEVVRLLEQAGFTVERLHGDLDRTPFRLGARRLLVTARRTGSS
jgi:SAM-dependent methyltransferase